ncbi:MULTISPECIES: PEP/pyruvate-binding domain-containing protein [unclassified Nocardioides]|uniref:PEP/pyruvate-binding domain-containing protein n=1 Tax=unclassified Nocardioides TaxID=2615069 RepID=UPI0009F10E43|nr:MULTISPECIES: PEP/pyruvate-binding domain-containing protein [unclassified Nocardioides]GAW51857.1 Putative phosphoenolpyruvate synthase [Nocardioides sp. PD653-B2]
MSECPSAIPFGTLTTEHHPRVGGKCASLGTMSQAGLPVPPGFAVTTRVFRDAKAHSGSEHRLVEIVDGALDGLAVITQDALEEVAAQARELLMTWEIPEEHETRIRQMYDDLCRLSGLEDVPVAVRSSSTAEDSPDASFAGEHDTYLWVCGIEDVLEKIRCCWASLYTGRAIMYRHELGYDHDKVDMAVGVQKMVRPRAAGVAFTLDPTNGDRSGICIDAAWGFGEGVVSGDVTPDNFLVDKVMWSINRRTISPKTHAHLLTEVEGSGHPRVSRVPVPEDRVNAPSLTDEEILTIARLARAAEKHYGCPQDIEWAVDDDLPAGQDAVLLQARPETVWSKKHHAVGAKPDPMASIVDTLVNPLYAKRRTQPA